MGEFSLQEELVRAFYALCRAVTIVSTAVRYNHAAFYGTGRGGESRRSISILVVGAVVMPGGHNPLAGDNAVDTGTVSCFSRGRVLCTVDASGPPRAVKINWRKYSPWRLGWRRQGYMYCSCFLSMATVSPGRRLQGLGSGYSSSHAGGAK